MGTGAVVLRLARYNTDLDISNLGFGKYMGTGGRLLQAQDTFEENQCAVVVVAFAVLRFIHAAHATASVGDRASLA